MFPFLSPDAFSTLENCCNSCRIQGSCCPIFSYVVRMNEAGNLFVDKNTVMFPLFVFDNGICKLHSLNSKLLNVRF